MWFRKPHLPQEVWNGTITGYCRPGGTFGGTWAKGSHSLPKTRLISMFDEIVQDFMYFEFRASPRMEISHSKDGNFTASLRKLLEASIALFRKNLFLFPVLMLFIISSWPMSCGTVPLLISVAGHPNGSNYGNF